MSRLMRLWLAGLLALATFAVSADAATLLYRKKGEQFFDASGNPLNGGKLYFYEAGTTNAQTTYSDSSGTTPNSNPVVLDSAGRLTVPIYFGDSDSFSNYKETLTTSADVTVSPWPFDNIPAAVPAETAAAFAPPLHAWTQVTSAASPVALTAADAGKAYEADTTSGNIEFDLPSAASVGDGKGFVFKKTVAANSMVIDPSGSETIDNSSTSLTITSNSSVVGIYSNGAEWYRIDGVVTNEMLTSSFVNGLTATTAPAASDELLVQLASGGAFRKVTRQNLVDLIAGTVQATTSGTAIDFTSLPTGVRRITVALDEVSLSGSDSLLIQLGDSGGVEATGYTGQSIDVQGVENPFTTGFGIESAGAGNAISGNLTIVRVTGNTWVASGNFTYGGGGGGDLVVTAGRKELSAEFDRIRITRNGTDTFDAGQVNIVYEY